MIFKLPAWVGERTRRQQLGDHISRTQRASFGFNQVPEAEKSRWVYRHFDSVAHCYDFMNTVLSFGIHYLWKRSAIRMMRLSSGDNVLDVCGGTGDLSIMAVGRVLPGGRVVLYDINRAMIVAGRHKLKTPVLQRNISHVQGNAESISFPDASFDAAMVGFGIRNVTHMEKGFQEMYRVLKPGGRFMCLEFSKPKDPLFRWLYDVYSFYLMPWAGQLLAGSRQAYTHLPETIRLFPLPAELARTLGQIGFCDVRFRRLTNGIVVIHTAVKPGPAKISSQ